MTSGGRSTRSGATLVHDTRLYQAGLRHQKDTTIALTAFNLAIGSTDAHAKSVSVLHLPDGRACDPRGGRGQ